MQCWALFNCLFQGFAFGDLLERHNVLQADGDQPWHAWRKVAEQPERACISGVLQTAKALRELRDLKTLLYSGLPVCLNLHPCRHQVLDTKLGQGAEVPKDEMGSEEYIRISHSLRSRVERFPRLPPSFPRMYVYYCSCTTYIKAAGRGLKDVLCCVFTKGDPRVRLVALPGVVG